MFHPLRLGDGHPPPVGSRRQTLSVAMLTLSEILLLFVGVLAVSRGAMDRLAVAADMETKREALSPSLHPLRMIPGPDRPTMTNPLR